MTNKSFDQDMPGGSGEEYDPDRDEDRRVRDRHDDEDAPPRRSPKQPRHDTNDDDDEYDDEQEPKSKKKLIIVGGGAAVVLLALLYTGTGTKLYEMATGQNAAPPPVAHHASRPKLANQNRSAKSTANLNSEEPSPQTGGDNQALFPPSDDDVPPAHTARRRMPAPAQDDDQAPPATLQEKAPGDGEHLGHPSSMAEPGGVPFSGPSEPQAASGVGGFAKDVTEKLNAVLAKLDDMTKKMADIEKISERQEAKIEQGAIAVVNMSAKLDSLVGRMNDQQANIESLKDTIHAPAAKILAPADDNDPNKSNDAPRRQKTAKKEDATSSHPHVIRGYILKGVSEGDPPTSVFIKTPNGAIMKNINEDVGGSAGVIKEIRQIKGGSWEVVTTKGIIPAG